MIIIDKLQKQLKTFLKPDTEKRNFADQPKYSKKCTEEAAGKPVLQNEPFNVWLEEMGFQRKIKMFRI